MERKLASIQIVKSLDTIPDREGNPSSLELVKFESIGWQCVARKGEFAPGDRAVYIEISTIVPDHPVFEFLRARGFKVKTIRLLGVLSQGLVLPLDTLHYFVDVDLDEMIEGDDVGPIIGITRNIPPEEIKLANGGRVRSFPTDLVPKTDEERLQSVPFVLKEMAGQTIVATQKMDGTSATYFVDQEDNALRVCSRNMEKMENDGSVYFTVLRDNPAIERWLREHPNLALQGEICSPAIQKNRLGLREPEFFVFNVWDIQMFCYVPRDETNLLLDDSGVKQVPVLYLWDDFQETDIDKLLELAKGNYPDTSNPQEGMVLRPFYAEGFSFLLGGRLSCKVINNDYLLKGGE